MEHSQKYAQEYEKVKLELKDFFAKYQNLSFEAKMASIVSSLNNNISNLFFVGFYVVTPNFQSNELELQMGPYQSTILATPRIGLGKGVCGTAWKENKTQVVDDVQECNNYIPCDDVTKSEIVVPVKNKSGSCIAVLDIDSEILCRFRKDDQEFFEFVIQNYLE